jgi:cytochrome c2
MDMKLLPLLCFLVVIFPLTTLANPVPEGKTIFISRCAACHNVNKQLTGPALAGVHERHDINWIIKFVHSSQSVIKSGDKKAVALFQQFNQIQMPDHADLSEQNIKDVVEYIKSETKVASASDGAPFGRPEKLKATYLPVSISNYGFFITVIGLVVLLTMALIFLVRVKEYERSATT